MSRLRRIDSRPPPSRTSWRICVRGMLWGPAEFVGLPSGRLIAKGVLAALLGTEAIVGTTLFGAGRSGPHWPPAGWGSCGAAALALHLFFVGAGRALVGITALLGICLALRARRAAAGVVLAERGRVQSVVVTSVDVP